MGAVVRDVDGNVFVDFSSGAVVANLGHVAGAGGRRVRVEEAGRLMHFFDFATPPRAAFFEALARTLPPELQTFQMYSTGSEAVEAALRLAKSYTGVRGHLLPPRLARPHARGRCPSWAASR